MATRWFPHKMYGLRKKSDYWRPDEWDMISTCHGLNVNLVEHVKFCFNVWHVIGSLCQVIQLKIYWWVTTFCEDLVLPLLTRWCGEQAVLCVVALVSPHLSFFVFLTVFYENVICSSNLKNISINIFGILWEESRQLCGQCPDMWRGTN